MRGEMPQNIDFNPREIYPSQSINAGENIGNSSIFDKKLNNGNGLTDNGSFEILAKNAAKDNKLIDVKENNENSIVFQQDITKDILAIKNDDLRKAAEEAKEYWEKYDNKVRVYAERFSRDEDKIKVIKDFERLKVSIQGSLAAIRFFEEKGFKARFSSTKEDRFNQCDLFFEKSGEKEKDYNLALQLKSYRSSAKSAKEQAKDAENLISVDKYELDNEEKQKSFEKLRSYCIKLSRETGKNYFPVFMNMPVSIDAHNSKGNEPKKYPLVDERGFFKPGQLKPTMDTLWKGYDNVLTKRNK